MTGPEDRCHHNSADFFIVPWVYCRLAVTLDHAQRSCSRVDGAHAALPAAHSVADLLVQQESRFAGYRTRHPLLRLTAARSCLVREELFASGILSEGFQLLSSAMATSPCIPSANIPSTLLGLVGHYFQAGLNMEDSTRQLSQLRTSVKIDFPKSNHGRDDPPSA